MYKKILLAFLFIGVSFYGHSQLREIVEPSYIKTIEFKGSTAQSQLPIIRLGEPLQLTFDAINGEEADFFYTITHHNFDWSLSDLSKGEYLDGFDEVRIDAYDNSLNTLQIYSNYKLQIPNRDTRALQKSGNYLLTVYDDNNTPIFSRKFMVIENIANVGVEIKRSRDLKFIEEKQVVQFSIDSPTLLLINPKQTVKTLVMQNSNFKNAITNLKPQYTIGTELIYRYDKEASFWGGNEFLFFDNKEIRGANNSVRYIELNDLYENYLFTNGSRKNKPYTYNPDINGNFVVRNIDARNQDIEADYAYIHFNLIYVPEIGDKELHIFGNFNNWTIDGSTYLQYNKENQTYQNTRLFKQGFYNYKYVLVNPDGTIDQGAVSGNNWETENDYTVLVYYRDLGARFDRIIGMGMANSTNITNN